jgi:hypothetical protein
VFNIYSAKILSSPVAHLPLFVTYYIQADPRYHSCQNLLSSIVLVKNVKRKIYRNIIFPAVLCGCET